MVAKNYLVSIRRLLFVLLGLFCSVSMVFAFTTSVPAPPPGSVPAATGTGTGVPLPPAGGVPAATGTGSAVPTVSSSPSTGGGSPTVDNRPLYQRIVEPSSEDVLTPGFATGSTPSISGLMNYLFDLLVRRILPLIVGVMVLFIVWGGYQYIMSAGDPAKVKQSRDLILYSIIAMILALSALTIVTILNNIVLQTTP